MKYSTTRIGAVALGVLLALLGARNAVAHRSGCHRWHTCPSDHGTYTTRSSPPKATPEASPQAAPPSNTPSQTNTGAPPPPPGHEPARQPARTAEYWDTYELELTAYCEQTQPHTMRQCIREDLERQEDTQAKARAVNYRNPSLHRHAPRPLRVCQRPPWISSHARASTNSNDWPTSRPPGWTADASVTRMPVNGRSMSARF